MSKIININHAGKAVALEVPKTDLTVINISTCGPALGGGAFVYVSTTDHITNSKRLWHNEKMMLGERCVISVGDTKNHTEQINPQTIDGGSIEGFSVSINGKSVRAGLPSPSSVGVLISDKEGDCALSITGYSSDNIAYTWYKRKVEEGDIYIIDFINLSSVDEPISKLEF